jgi:hypothetical protein
MFCLFWGNKEYIHIDLMEGDYLGDLGIDVLVVLKATLKKIWTALSWFRVRFKGGTCCWPPTSNYC